MSLPKFKFYSLKEDYTTDKDAGSIADRDIIFIEDTREIISHGVVISGDLSEDDVNTLLANYATISDGTIPVSELPIATDSSVGVVSIDPSSSLTIDSSGVLSDSPLVSLSEGDTVVLNYDADGVPAATSFSRTVSLLIDGAEAGVDNEKYNLTGALISVDGTEYGTNHNVHPFITWTVDSENNTITVSFDYTVSDDNTAALDAILAAGGFTLTGTCNKGIFCSSYFRVLDLSAVANSTALQTNNKVQAAALNAIVAACGLTTEGLYEASSELLDGTTSLRQALDIVAEYVSSLETKVTELEERITALEG